MTPLEVYAQEGWWLWRGLLEAQVLGELVGATERLEAEARDFDRNRLVRGVSFELQTASGRRGEPPVFNGALRKIRFPSKREPAFAALRRNTAVLDAVKALGVTAPKCLVDQLNFKLPKVGTGFPFHQDTAFLQGESKRRVDELGGVNLIIALDSADADNGGFEVLGRTHFEERAFPYDRATTNEGVFDETFRTLVPLQPGDALFFHPRLAHGSGPNRSARQRRLVTLWFRGGGSTVRPGGKTRPLRPLP